jgi:hypothetical protein
LREIKEMINGPQNSKLIRNVRKKQGKKGQRKEKKEQQKETGRKNTSSGSLDFEPSSLQSIGNNEKSWLPIPKPLLMHFLSNPS